MSLEEAVRAMLVNSTTLSASPNGVPDARVTHGFRLQQTELPAVTFEVTGVEPGSIPSVGTSSSGTRMATVEVRSIAVEAVDAIAIAAKVRSTCTPGSYGGLNLDAILYQGHRLEAQPSGEGDEAQPAEAVSEITIYYRE
jgi:hypothetical protein